MAAAPGDQTGPNPTDRARRGGKRHLMCDREGVPLAVRLTVVNRGLTTMVHIHGVNTGEMLIKVD